MENEQLLFEQHPSPMLIYDLDTLRILKVNRAFTDKYKYLQEEITQQGITIKDIRPKEDIPKLLGIVKNMNGNGVADSGFHRHQSKEGETFYVQVTSQSYRFENKNSRLVVLNDITEQVEAEKKSARALEDLKHHISKSPLASVKLDSDFNIIEWSNQAEDISGYARDEVMGKNLFSFDLLCEKQKILVKKNLGPLARDKKHQTKFEMKAGSKTGKKFHLRVHASALRDDAGRFQSILTLIEDVTDQKKSEIKYQRLFENANDSIFIMKGTRFVDCNKQAEVLFKTERENIIGKVPVDFSPEIQPNGEPSKIEAEKRIQKALHEGENIFEWQHENAAGELIDAEVSLNKVNFPDGEYVQAIVRDITDKKSNEVKMRKNEQLFRNLFLNSPAALVMVDRKDRIEVVNESFEKMFGYSLKNIRGKNIDELVVPPEEIDRAPKMKTRSYVGDNFQIEGVRLTKSGKKKDMLIAGMPVNIDGEPVAGLGMYIDITDQKNSEKKLKKSLDEKQLLLEEVHHRVKNNLAIISGLLELEAMNSEDDTTVRNVMRQSQLRVHSMGMIHEKLYQAGDFSNIKLENYVSELVLAIYEALRFDQSEINVDLNVQSEDIELNINQAIPCALIINELVTNALKHAFKDNESGEINVSLKEDFGTIILKVEDNGCGLPADFEDIVGKSLGHLLIKKLVKQLQGEVVAETNPGEGTRYTISFQKKDKSGSACSGRLMARAGNGVMAE